MLFDQFGNAFRNPLRRLSATAFIGEELQPLLHKAPHAELHSTAKGTSTPRSLSHLHCVVKRFSLSNFIFLKPLDPIAVSAQNLI